MFKLGWILVVFWGIWNGIWYVVVFNLFILNFVFVVIICWYVEFVVDGVVMILVFIILIEVDVMVLE